MLSTPVAALPLGVLLGLLAFGRVSAWKAALGGFLTAAAVACLAFGMPLRMVAASASMGFVFAVLRIVWLIVAAVFLYDIAVEKNEDNNFRALLMQCTHQENQLTQQGNGFHCSLHGSQFDKEGRVVKGPAERPLKQFPVSIENDQLIIHINAHP